MRAWIVSIVFHILLICILFYLHIPNKIEKSRPIIINSYAYSKQNLVLEPKYESISNFPAKDLVDSKNIDSSISDLNSIHSKNEKEVSRNILAKVKSKQKEEITSINVNDEIKENTDRDTGSVGLSLAERALASASETIVPAFSNSVIEKNEIHGVPDDVGIAPAMIKEIKNYADGSALVQGENGCWKVPSADSRKNAIWLSTSTKCQNDTTVDDINKILDKRRIYR